MTQPQPEFAPVERHADDVLSALGLASAEKIVRATEDNDLRSKMITEGSARAREFTWRRAAEQTCRVYNEVLGEA